MPLTRRQLLALAGGAGATVATATWSGLLRERAAAAPPPAKKTLVVVQLGGGNDALNTFVPDDGRYRDARPSLAVPEGDLLEAGGVLLHPALEPILDRWGDVSVVHGVGYSHAGRSHFECSQHWWDGTEPHDPSTTGWLGRWLDATAPAGDPDPLRGVALGAGSAALRAEHATSTVILRPDAFRVMAPPGASAAALADALERTAAPVDARGLVAAAQAATASAMRSVDRLSGALSSSSGDGGLAGSLATAADLVTRDLGIEVLTLGAGGFDTHATQASTHAALLADLAEGLDGFWRVVTSAGMAERVLVMTTSEFGRRVAENGSGGTDHGLGSSQLVMGPSVRSGVVGEIDLAHLHDGDLHPTVDPRALYAEVLRWLGGPVDDVVGRHDALGVVA